MASNSNSGLPGPSEADRMPCAVGLILSQPPRFATMREAERAMREMGGSRVTLKSTPGGTISAGYRNKKANLTKEHLKWLDPTIVEHAEKTFRLCYHTRPKRKTPPPALDKGPMGASRLGVCKPAITDLKS